MTVAEMAKIIGTQRLLGDGKGLRFTVTVEDMRESWQRPQCLVSPVDGAGQRWVNLDTLRVLTTSINALSEKE